VQVGGRDGVGGGGAASGELSVTVQPESYDCRLAAATHRGRCCRHQSHNVPWSSNAAWRLQQAWAQSAQRRHQTGLAARGCTQQLCLQQAGPVTQSGRQALQAQAGSQAEPRTILTLKKSSGGSSLATLSGLSCPWLRHA
jgi:hypothetical protein